MPGDVLAQYTHAQSGSPRAIGEAFCPFLVLLIVPTNEPPRETDFAVHYKVRLLRARTRVHRVHANFLISHFFYFTHSRSYNNMRLKTPAFSFFLIYFPACEPAVQSRTTTRALRLRSTCQKLCGINTVLARARPTTSPTKRTHVQNAAHTNAKEATCQNKPKLSTRLSASQAKPSRAKSAQAVPVPAVSAFACASQPLSTGAQSEARNHRPG